MAKAKAKAKTRRAKNPNLDGFNADERVPTPMEQTLAIARPGLDALSLMAEAVDMDIARRVRQITDPDDLAPLPFTPDTPWPPSSPRLTEFARGLNTLIDLAHEADADQLSRGLTDLEATRQLPIPDYVREIGSSLYAGGPGSDDESYEEGAEAE